MLLFDANLHSGKPADMSPLRPFRLIGEAEAMRSTPSELAASAIGRLCCVNIESAANVPKLPALLDAMHEAQPGLRLGVYALLPPRNYWAPALGGLRLRAWYNADGATRHHGSNPEGLSDKVDVVFPSLYTFYDDPKGWAKYARENIRLARRHQKQVYPFLWPEYHNSNAKLGGTYIGDDYWRMQLDVCRELADGAVVWGGWWDGKRRPWDESVSWWRIVKETA